MRKERIYFLLMKPFTPKFWQNFYKYGLLVLLALFVGFLLTGCSMHQELELEHRCSEKCNEVIENLQNFEFDSQAIISKLFKREVCEEPSC